VPNFRKRNLKMQLYEKIKSDLLYAIKNKEKNKINHLRLILGEIQRLEKGISDENTISLLNSIAKKARKNIEKYKYNIEENKQLISIIENYTETKQLSFISESEIIKFIKENVDFNKENNKNYILGVVMKYLKGNANPGIVKKIIEENFNFE